MAARPGSSSSSTSPTPRVAWLGEWWTDLGLALDVVRGDLGEPVAEPLESDRTTTGSSSSVAPWGPATTPSRRGWPRPVPCSRTPWRGRSRRSGSASGTSSPASALGGRVERNPSGRTVGLVPVALTAVGLDDPLLAGFDGHVAVHYNDDVVTSPPAGVDRARDAARRPSSGAALRPEGLGRAVPPGDLARGVRRLAAVGLPRRPHGRAGGAAGHGHRFARDPPAPAGASSPSASPASSPAPAPPSPPDPSSPRRTPRTPVPLGTEQPPRGATAW